MLQKYTLNFKSVLLTFVLTFGLFDRHCDAQGNKEVTSAPDGHEGDISAFFALRSCHQLLQGDSGEFFSPDYLCSNPSLWCNWTIQVDPGKRIQLHLEDLTPDDSCHLKQDQIHVDEPVGSLLGHKVLQKCWREAKFTSSSNTMHVVLLIGGWPTPPYRGFHSRYQAFGPLVLYNPMDGFTKTSTDSEPSSALLDFREYDPRMSSQETEPEHSDAMYDYYDQHLAETAERPWGLEEVTEMDSDSEVVENLLSSSENYSTLYQFTVAPSLPASTNRIFRSGRGVVHIHSIQSDSPVHPVSPQQQRDSEHYELNTSSSAPPTTTPGQVKETVIAENESTPQNWTEEMTLNTLEQAADDQNWTEPNKESNQIPFTTEVPETYPTAHTHPHPNMVEPLSDHRGNLNVRNRTEVPHLPGDHLFEVAVEVNFIEDLEESWDTVTKSLLQSVKALINKQLEALRVSTSPKRVKRLHAGVLYIIWLQIGQRPRGVPVHSAVHAALQALVGASGGFRKNAVIMSLSTADVNECGTQLVLCDVNADCVNEFGSYSCHCRAGFQDQSRLGSGGTICIETKVAGCTSGISPETKGVYVLFFLLSSLILMLLAVVTMLYRRHRHGAFLVRCNSSNSSSSISPPDPDNHQRPNDNYSCPADSDLPPPPPPVRGHRDGWPPVKGRCPPMNLQLLRFSPLGPPEEYIDPQQGGKM